MVCIYVRYQFILVPYGNHILRRLQGVTRVRCFCSTLVPYTRASAKIEIFHPLLVPFPLLKAVGKLLKFFAPVYGMGKV